MNNMKIIYVGDPMCSWCWGIAPGLMQLKEHFAKEKIDFEIIVGGLRPGGGDAWDDKMKEFLKHHWQEVNAKSGQPFGYSLFDKENFNYDTEPACRAIVTAKNWPSVDLLSFFEAIQRKFYVDSEDPNEPVFYKDICEKFGVNFDDFKSDFLSSEAKNKTNEEFMLNRQWGIRGYPAVLVQSNNQLNLIANGFSTFEEMKERVEALTAQD